MIADGNALIGLESQKTSHWLTIGHHAPEQKDSVQLNQHGVSTYQGPSPVPGIGDTLEKKRNSHLALMGWPLLIPGALLAAWVLTLRFQISWKVDVPSLPSLLLLLPHLTKPSLEKQINASDFSAPELWACLVLSLLLKQMIPGGGWGLAYS